MTTSSLRGRRSAVPAQTKQPSSRVPSRGIKWCTLSFPKGNISQIRVSVCSYNVSQWVRVNVHSQERDVHILTKAREWASDVHMNYKLSLIFQRNLLLKFKMSFSCFFTDAPSLKSSGASSVKMAKVVAVAQSKLTFIKPAQTGIWWRDIVKMHLCDVWRGIFAFVYLLKFWFFFWSPALFFQPYPGTRRRLPPRTCSMTRGGLRSRRRVSLGGSTTSSPQMTLKSTPKLPKVTSIHSNIQQTDSVTTLGESFS